MIQIKELVIENAGRFVGSHSLNLSDLPKLIQVDGKNLNTGGSSGSGKSTLFNCLDYLLDVGDIPSTVLQSRLTKEKLKVSAILETDCGEYKISRGGGKGLVVENLRTGQIFEGSSKVAEEELDKILGIPRKILRLMYHKKQKEGGFFLNLTAKESHEFLAECLDLNKWVLKQESLTVKLKDLENQLVSVSSSLDFVKQKLQTSQSKLSNLVKPIPEPGLERLKETLQQSLTVINEQLNEIKVKQKQDLDSIPTPTLKDLIDLNTDIEYLKYKKSEVELRKKISEYEKERNSNIAQLELRKNEIKIQLLHLDQLKSDTVRDTKELNQLKDQIVKIKQSTCPTCLQHWEVEQDRLKQLIEKANILKTTIEKAEDDIAKADGLKLIIEKLDSDILTIKSSINPYENSIDFVLNKKNEIEQYVSNKNAIIARENNLANDQFRKAQQEIQSRYSEQVQLITSQAADIYEAIKNTEQKISQYNQQKAIYESLYKQLADSLNQDKAEESQLKERELQLKTDFEHVKEAIRFIKSYTNQLFQSTLQTVADKASSFMARIPNMSTATISFEAFRQSKNGTVREEITPLISMDGELSVPVKSLSGGERTAIDLAIDLAVIDMIESITGKGLDLFILDEPFNGLDHVSIENCLEIIKNHDTNKRIVIVDHSSETKEMIGFRIIVERSGQESEIKIYE